MDWILRDGQKLSPKHAQTRTACQQGERAALLRAAFILPDTSRWTPVTRARDLEPMRRMTPMLATVLRLMGTLTTYRMIQAG